MARKQTVTAPGAQPERASCAYMSCLESAIIRELMPTGWADLCLHHYEAHYRDEAHKRMRELGLTRKPDEAYPVWRKRVMGYIKEKSRTSIRRFDADGLEDEWSAA